MSLFLVMVEFGRTGQATKAPTGRSPVRLIPVSVRPRGPTSLPRAGYLVTDGVSSGRLRVVGNTTVGRAGEALRTACQQLVRERIELGLQVALAFIFIDGTMAEIVINVEGTPEVTLDQLPERFVEMRMNEPIRVAGARQPLL